MAVHPFSDHVFAVILAGGSGTRFWPKSRKKHPKQLCKIGSSERSMLSTTLSRLDGCIPPERRIIVTHKDQAEETLRDVGNHCLTVLAEPEAKNTAAALAMGAMEVNLLNQTGKSPIMISLHADAVIKETNLFIESLHQAVSIAENNHLTLLGIKPTYAETGYGYIEIGEKLSGPGFKVKSFKEKPNSNQAEEYLRDERLFWNSGIFVWKASLLLEELGCYCPEIPEYLNCAIGNLKSFKLIDAKDLAFNYAKLPKIAIDNAILEKSLKVAMVGTVFSWQDVGSWGALSQTFTSELDPSGNLTYGDVTLIDTSDTTVDTDGPLVATLGLSSMIVVAAKGAILVCPKSRSQDVKLIVEHLQKKGREEFL